MTDRVRTLELRADGTAVRRDTAACGGNEQRGRVRFFEFAQLSIYADSLRLAAGPVEFLRPFVHDGHVVSVILLDADGRSLEIVDQNDFAPPDIWALQRAIEGVATHVEWSECQQQ